MNRTTEPSISRTVPQLALGDILVRAHAVQREQARLSAAGERAGLELEPFASVVHDDDIRRRVCVHRGPIKQPIINMCTTFVRTGCMTITEIAIERASGP
eukprot:scaffold42267_cov66-Phaeocystis_antarctica.AAC.6